jgi:predicted ArsR family transcriptional regulator
MNPTRLQFRRLVWIVVLVVTFAVFGLGIVLTLSAFEFPQVLPVGLVMLVGGAAAHFWAIARLAGLRRARNRAIAPEDLRAQVRAYAAGRGGMVTVAEVAQALWVSRPVALRALRELAAAGECAPAEAAGEPAYRFAAGVAAGVDARARLGGTFMSWVGALGDGAGEIANVRSHEPTLEILARDARRLARRAGGAVTAEEVAAGLAVSPAVARRTLDALAARGGCRREGEAEGARYVFAVGKSEGNDG